MISTSNFKKENIQSLEDDTKSFLGHWRFDFYFQFPLAALDFINTTSKKHTNRFEKIINKQKRT
jgi:hypothetical protein